MQAIDRNHSASSALDRSRRRAHGRGLLSGLSFDGLEVREELERGRIVRFVREERYNVPVPAALKPVVHNIIVKRNIGFELDTGGEIIDERPLGRVLVIVPHKGSKIAGGIVGIPGTKAETKSRRKIGFSHLTISWIPPAGRDEAAGPRKTGYDERAYALTFYHPRSGSRQLGEKGGEVVHRIVDELSVLEWIFNNGLEALYQTKPLLAHGLLPKIDKQRVEENALAAKAQALFGRPMMQPHPESAFHRTRLLDRCRQLAMVNVEVWDEDGRAQAERRAHEAFAETVIGRTLAAEIVSGEVATQQFYVDEARGFAYALYLLPGARYILAVDSVNRDLRICPLAVEVSGLAQLEVAGHVLTLAGCREVDWSEFSAYAQGIGAALPTSPITYDTDHI